MAERIAQKYYELLDDIEDVRYKANQIGYISESGLLITRTDYRGLFEEMERGLEKIINKIPTQRRVHGLAQDIKSNITELKGVTQRYVQPEEISKIEKQLEELRDKISKNKDIIESGEDYEFIQDRGRDRGGSMSLDMTEENAIFDIIRRTQVIVETLRRLLDVFGGNGIKAGELGEWYVNRMYEIEVEYIDPQTDDIDVVETKVKGDRNTLYLKRTDLSVPEASYTIHQTDVTGMNEHLNEFLEGRGYYTRDTYREISRALGMDLVKFHEQYHMDDREVNWSKWEELADKYANDLEYWGERDLAELIGKKYVQYLKENFNNIIIFETTEDWWNDKSSDRGNGGNGYDVRMRIENSLEDIKEDIEFLRRGLFETRQVTAGEMESLLMSLSSEIEDMMNEAIGHVDLNVELGNLLRSIENLMPEAYEQINEEDFDRVLTNIEEAKKKVR